MNLYKQLLIAMLFLLTACASSNNEIDDKIDLAKISQQYFSVYAQRKDFEKLMAFYADNAQLEDMIYGHFAKSKADIRLFLNWSNGEFSLVDNGAALVVTKQVISNDTVVTEGYFTPFNYNGKKLGPWRFIIWLEFDRQGKVVRHVDWINYTPKADFIGGENRNSVIMP